jgi:hypothetical protein
MEFSQRLFDHYSNFTKYKQLFKLNQITIKSLSTPQTNHILSLLDSGHSAYKLSSTTGVYPSIVSILCSKYYTHPPTSSSRQPSKLSSININYKIYLIISSKWRVLFRSPKHFKILLTNTSLLRQFITISRRLEWKQ